ncbi:MAG: hypothetical protein WCY19_04980 [Candidatus Gastranaerophilaceae bacterium]
MIKIQDLKALVGGKYEETDIKGNYLNCFSPVYLIYPNAPKFKKPKGNRCFDYALLKVKKYCSEIPKEDMKPFDIIVFYKVFRAMHIGIYLGDGLIFHCGLDKKYQIIRLVKYYEFIKGVFRYNEKE